MNQRILFYRLVENAMDFLNRSIDEFSKHPKFSVIHFHAAVELFLKARLMAEHWSLVVSKRRDADWEKFVEGDFVSVTLEEALEKLNNIVRSGFNEQGFETFKRLNTHRNKFVHFIHTSAFTEENENLRTEIARQQLTAWYFLHHALTVRWSDVFSPWISNLENIDIELRKLKDYLYVLHEQLKSELDKLSEQGVKFGDCPSCEFPSLEISDEIGEVYGSQCHVCGLTGKSFNCDCPDCETLVVFTDEGFGNCKKCKREFEPYTLAETVNDHGDAYTAFKDGDDSWQLGNCGDCDGYHTLVRLRNHEWRFFCTSCFGEFDSIYVCGYCNEPNTDDMDYSYWTGCNFCDGKGFD